MLVGHNEDIVGLEVAVDNVDPVRGVESLGHLVHDVGRPRWREATILFLHGAQRSPWHELHGQVHQPVAGLAEVEHAGHSVMLDASRVGGLAVESGHRIRVLHHPGIHHLDGRLLRQPYVPSEIHAPHAALAQQFAYLVAVGDNAPHKVRGGGVGAKSCPINRAERVALGVRTAAHGASFFHDDRLSTLLTW